MTDRARIQVRTSLDPEVWSDVGAGTIGISLPVEVESSVLPTGASTSANQSLLDKFSTNEIDQSTATTTYIGTEDKDGAYLIKKIDTSSGTVFTYASIALNPSVTTYAIAWAARATTLVYGTFNQAF